MRATTFGAVCVLATLAAVALTSCGVAQAGRDGESAPSHLALSRETPHLTLRAALSSDSLEPGVPVTMHVDIVPKPGMHVYAPGTDYRPVTVMLEPHPLLEVHDPVYPKPTVYLFKPLNEKVLVYSSRFRITRDISTRPTGNRKAGEPTIKVPLDGEIEYQACDDSVCYLPTVVPVAWTLNFKP